MQEKIQPGLDVSSDKYFPLLESAKSMEKNEKHEENKRWGLTYRIPNTMLFQKTEQEQKCGTIRLRSNVF